MTRHVIPLNQLGRHDVDTVGGKNSSLGEMLRELSGLGIQVPDGFATTAAAFREFLKQGGLDARIHARLKALDVDDVVELAKVGASIRGEILATPLPPALQDAVMNTTSRNPESVSSVNITPLDPRSLRTMCCTPTDSATSEWSKPWCTR